MNHQPNAFSFLMKVAAPRLQAVVHWRQVITGPAGLTLKHTTVFIYCNLSK